MVGSKQRITPTAGKHTDKKQCKSLLSNSGALVTKETLSKYNVSINTYVVQWCLMKVFSNEWIYFWKLFLTFIW